MDLHDGSGTQERFRTYAADLASVLGHADRVRPFEDYCVRLLSAEGRKSVEPLAAVTAPERTAAQHQSLLHLVAQAPWSPAQPVEDAELAQPLQRRGDGADADAGPAGDRPYDGSSRPVRWLRKSKISVWSTGSPVGPTAPPCRPGWCVPRSKSRARCQRRTAAFFGIGSKRTACVVLSDHTGQAA